VSRLWRIAPSRVKVDRKYIEAGHFPESVLVDGPGCGLWCAKKGEHVIHFDGPVSVTVRAQHPVFLAQSKYMADIAGPETTDVYVPTMSGLECYSVYHGFIVQNDQHNPTHEFGWCPFRNRPCLYPLRVVDVGEEFTFNYGMDTVGATNHPTKPNPRGWDA